MTHPDQSASHYALQAVLAGLAHDVNNPLNSIATNAELALLLAERSPEKIPEILRRIADDCRRCANVMQDLLKASHIEEPVQQLDLTQLLETVCTQVASDLKLRAGTLALEPVAALLQGQKAALARAVRELLVNAVEAGAGRVRVAMQIAGAEVLVEFFDDGCGIEAELAPRLLRAFHAPRGRGRPGIGVGLGIARRLILDQGGRLELVSASGSGRPRFRIRLPLSKAGENFADL